MSHLPIARQMLSKFIPPARLPFEPTVPWGQPRPAQRPDVPPQSPDQEDSEEIEECLAPPFRPNRVPGPENLTGWGPLDQPVHFERGLPGLQQEVDLYKRAYVYGDPEAVKQPAIEDPNVLGGRLGREELEFAFPEMEPLTL